MRLGRWIQRSFSTKPFFFRKYHIQILTDRSFKMWRWIILLRFIRIRKQQTISSCKNSLFHRKMRRFLCLHYFCLVDPLFLRKTGVFYMWVHVGLSLCKDDLTGFPSTEECAFVLTFSLSQNCFSILLMLFSNMGSKSRYFALNEWITSFCIIWV